MSPLRLYKTPVYNWNPFAPALWYNWLLRLTRKACLVSATLIAPFLTNAFTCAFVKGSTFAFFASMRGRATGRPPNAGLMAFVGMGGLIALVLAVVFAVMTFGA